MGKGKHTVVYKGRKKKSISYYAIKSVEKAQKPRVLQEVRVMHALSHPNILKFFQWYETSKHLWLILEYCVGGDLLSILRQDVLIPENSLHDFGRDLMSGLLFLHSQGILYCDLKPSNVLLDENGKLKLGDFGLARRLQEIRAEAPGEGGATKGTKLRGTPCYMAPELFAAEGAVHSRASDLWALGCVLYECACGHPPFVSSSLTALVNAILTQDPKPVPRASEPFQDLLRGLLQKNPRDRLGWAGLLAHPFWQFQAPLPPLPAEPAFAAFLRRHAADAGGDGAAPVPEPEAAEAERAARSPAKPPPASEPAQAGDAGPGTLRGSVDVLRLSQAARDNLEKEEHEDGEGGEYGPGPGGPGRSGDYTDLHLDNPDAELDFSEPTTPPQEPEPAAAAEDAAAEEVGNLRSAAAGAAHGDGPAAEDEEEAAAGAGEEQRQVFPAAGHLPGAGRSREGPLGLGKENVMRGSAQAHHHQRASAEKAAVAAPGPGGPGAGAPGGSERLPNLLFHASDLAVKPIVGNRRIEKGLEVRWDVQTLPFKPCTLQALLAAPQAELEAFLTRVYKSVSGSSPISEKVNTLAYFESLCSDTQAANILVNSSLMTLFVAKLKVAKMPSLRVRLATVMGLLVRHATFIADELADSGIVEALAGALRDKTVPVRRRAASTLGELLFYIATQQQDRQQAAAGLAGGAAGGEDAWHISGAAVTQFLRLLRPGEDEVAQHYAVKTLENVASHDSHWTARFATEATAGQLLQIAAAASGRGEPLKATAASALARLMRWHQPRLAQALFPRGKAGLKPLLAGLSEGNSKIQQPFLSMLLLALHADLQRPTSAGGSPVAGDERGLVPKLLAILEHGHSVLKAKALLCLDLLFQRSPAWLLAACGLKFVTLLEKLAKPAGKDEYLQSALGHLSDSIRARVPALLAEMDAELARLATQPPGGRTGGGAGAGGLPGPLAAFPVLLHLLTSRGALRGAVVGERLLATLSRWLPQVEALAFPGQPELWRYLLNALEALGQHPDLLHPRAAAEGDGEGGEGAGDGVARHLLPALAGLLAQSPSGDTRFLCMRLLCDLMLACLPAEGGPVDHGRPGAAAARARAWAVLEEGWLPQLPRLLGDEEPIPLYALKLCSGALEADRRRGPGDGGERRSLMARLVDLDVVPDFFAFLNLEHANNNVHNMRVCRLAVASPAVQAALLRDLDVAGQVAAVLAYAYENSVDPFLEPALELCAALADRERAELATAASVELGAAALGRGVRPVARALRGHPDPAVGAAAQACLAGFRALCGPEAAGE